MTAYVVDTNVAVVANGRDTHAGVQCQLECVWRLRALEQRGVVVLDQLGLIFEEYRRHLWPSGQPGVGDAFLRYLFDYQYDADRCELVQITPMADDARGFEEFPDDQALDAFDPDDRKFVAAACAAGGIPRLLMPPIAIGQCSRRRWLAMACRLSNCVLANWRGADPRKRGAGEKRALREGKRCQKRGKGEKVSGRGKRCLRLSRGLLRRRGRGSSWCGRAAWR